MKNKRIHIFVMDDLWELAKEKAAKDGYDKLSPYIRDLILSDLDSAKLSQNENK